MLSEEKGRELLSPSAVWGPGALTSSRTAVANRSDLTNGVEAVRKADSPVLSHISVHILIRAPVSAGYMVREAPAERLAYANAHIMGAFPPV